MTSREYILLVTLRKKRKSGDGLLIIFTVAEIGFLVAYGARQPFKSWIQPLSD